MLSIIISCLLIVSYFFFPSKPTQSMGSGDWMYKAIQERINAHFGIMICRWVTVSPIGFIFDEAVDGSMDSVPPSFVVTAKIKIDDVTKEFSALVGDMSMVSANIASAEIIRKVEKELRDLQLTGC